MEVNYQFHKLAALSPWEENPVLVQREAGWAPKKVWNFGLREISTASTGTRTKDRPERSPVSIPTTKMINGKAGNINLLTPNVNYSGRTAPLTSKVAFYISIQQI